MNYYKQALQYFTSLSRSDMLTLIGIGVAFFCAITTIGFIIWWDLKKKQRERFETFKTTFLPFIDILQKKELPHASASINDLKVIFANQETAMLKIKDRLRGKQLYRFATKWEEYKEEQKNFEEYILAVVTLEKQRIYKDEKLLNLITEILETAKNN